MNVSLCLFYRYDKTVYFMHFLFYIFHFLLHQHSYNGKAADVWALGVTLYALVFGNVPFSASSVLSTYEKIKTDELKFPDNISVSDDLKDLISKILHKDPNERLTLPQIKVSRVRREISV